jgi:nucleoside-specific outer membrane channel protein Tsx
MKKTLHRAPLMAAAAAALSLAASGASAANWSDTYVGFRTGTSFAEPFNPNDIKKNIFNFNHVSGYNYGSNFFNVDFLMSDKKDPAGAGSTNGAQEAYVVYRHTLDMAKITGMKLGFGPVKTTNLTVGFDWNTKTDAGYNSKKRMLVVGPTFAIDIPAGFLNVGIYQLWESNAPFNTFSGVSTPRYSYDPHPMLNLVWGIPLGKETGFSFEGFANFITSKGKNEFGGDTAAETNIDAQIMYDASSFIGAKPKTFKVGVEYQYWKNKFGNDASGAAGKGAFAKTPMLRVQYHF